MTLLSWTKISCISFHIGFVCSTDIMGDGLAVSSGWIHEVSVGILRWMVHGFFPISVLLRWLWCLPSARDGDPSVEVPAE